MNDGLYSIRMRASKSGLHISGAERIVKGSELARVTGELVARANGHERGRPDSVVVTIDSLTGKEILHVQSLNVTSREANSHSDGLELAASMLSTAGVSEVAVRLAIKAITTGASPDGHNMRGAMIIDAATGERLEPDRTRGVRARAADYEEGFLPELEEALTVNGLNRTHLKEALVISTKTANSPGAVAELCISDDPGYVTGYVASPKLGYVRITPMKESGDPMGGRAFFVDRVKFDIEEYVHYLREVPVLLNGPITIHV